MNDLKTAERSRLGEKLSDLMMWHVAARTMPCSEVPVLDILHEFRALASVGGTHTGGISRPSMTTRSRWRSRTLTEAVAGRPEEV